MTLQWRRVWGILAVAFLLTPFAVVAQEGRRGDRGDIQVTNDWENTVRVTLWKQRGEQISRRSWTIPQGQSVVLGDELAPHCRCAQAGIEALRTALRISLALAIHNGLDIEQEVRQVDFSAFATP